MKQVYEDDLVPHGTSLEDVNIDIGDSKPDSPKNVFFTFFTFFQTIRLTNSN